MLRVVDYLAQLLTHQAEVLRGLEDLFGETVLMACLERDAEPALPPSTPWLSTEARQAALLGPESASTLGERLRDVAGRPPATDPASAYALLATTVRDLKLPEPWEFHLWAYPYYRVWIEGPWNLESVIRTDTKSTEAASLDALIQEALASGIHWVERLGLPEPYRGQAMGIAESVWLKFRTRVLTQAGRARLSALTRTD